MDSILDGLNPAQLAAVTSDASVLQVLAPPGSGKTKTLTARVAHLIACHQLKPWNIIVCTFTVKAASEMKERIKAFIGDELARQLKLGTFHSVSLRYLKQYGQHIGLDKNFGIADTADSKAIVKRIVNKGNYTIDAGAARNRISTLKSAGGDKDSIYVKKSVEQQEFAQVFQEYEDTLAASNLLDYDDLLLRCCTLFRERPDCVSNVEALLIDEFQDTNNVQYELMGLLAQHHNSITIVGDPDQSIYGFRSAEIKNLTRMKERWPDTLTINLEDNYRSSGAILHAAQHIIEQDESRPPKKLQATHNYGLRPVLRKLPSAAAEADWLVSEVKRIQALTGNLLQASDFAVLLRSAALSRAIEASLGKAGVPYRMIGGVKFFDRMEVKLLIDYLRVIDEPCNSEAVIRIINVPSRRIGEETVRCLQEEARSKGVTLWDLIRESSQGQRRLNTKVAEPTRKGLAAFTNIILTCRKKLEGDELTEVTLIELVKLVVKKLSLENYLHHKYPEEKEHEARWANVEEFMALATEASDPEKLRAMIEDDALPVIDGVEQRATSGISDTLSVFLANIALTASNEKATDPNVEPVPQLTITTIHSAKGLEWPVVFIPACYDGSIPHSRADDNDEERRLLYVGMTRAQALLYLSCPVKNTMREDTSMSTFLQQPGATGFLEEHGPSIALPIVRGLAKTLRRDCPSAPTVAAGVMALTQDEDNYWPLNGEMPLPESAEWDHGKTSRPTDPLPGFGYAKDLMQQPSGASRGFASTRPGFQSVAAVYEENIEQAHLSKIDKRAKQAAAASGLDKPMSRKRQIEGQGSIAGFFSKQRKASPEPEPVEDLLLSKPYATSKSVGSTTWMQASSALRESDNASSAHNIHPVGPTSYTMSRHKPQNTPLHRLGTMQPTTGVQHNDYAFPCSPPEKLEQDENHDGRSVPTTNEGQTTSLVRPASTYHTTTMQTLAPQRRTLGTKRSLNGWASRGGRRP